MIPTWSIVMKLSPINSTQAFYGLWGNVQVDFYMKSGNESLTNTIDYHPFKDESLQEIHFTTGKTLNRELRDDLFYAYANDRDSVEISHRLPFTKTEYSRYKNKLSAPEEIELVENGLKKLKLYYYLNNYQNKYSIKTIIQKLKLLFM